VKILLVEDEQTTAVILKTTLEKWSYGVVCAEDGAAALEAMTNDPEIAMIITDWHMPNLDGEALCRRVRSTEMSHYVPIIMLTASHHTRDLVRGMDAGADAYLTKPVNLSELHAYVRVAERIIGLERRLADKIRELDRARGRMESDLEAAGRIQRSLLPDRPLRLPWVETAWAFDACTQTAGDMLNVVRLDEHRIGVYVLDVSGHGTQAALLSVSLSRVLTPYTQQGGLLKLGHNGTYAVPSPAEVAGELNQRFPVMRQSGQYFTFLYGIFDRRSRVLTFVSAGHPPPVLVSGEEARVVEAPTNFPIGWFPDVAYREHHIRLAPGDLVLFYTDGIEEARDPDEKELGIQEILATLSGRADWVADEAVTALGERVRDHTRGATPADDMTMVALRALDENAVTDRVEPVGDDSRVRE